MREIKYRGQRLASGHWLYGSLINNACFYTKTGEPEYAIFDSNFYEKYTCYEDVAQVLDDCEVIPDTIGQFTGLQDCEGKDIYESDIIGYRNIKGDIVCQKEVKWGTFNIGSNGFEYDQFVTGPHVEDEYMYSMMIEGRVEITGNIHEEKS